MGREREGEREREREREKHVIFGLVGKLNLTITQNMDIL